MVFCPSCNKPDSSIGSRASARNHLCVACDMASTSADIVASGGLVINGRLYRVGSDLSHNRGFGGSRYVITRHDGTVIETTNLQLVWSTTLPDNAAFTPNAAARLAA